jgi:hypothetical protein
MAEECVVVANVFVHGANEETNEGAEYKNIIQQVRANFMIGWIL